MDYEKYEKAEKLIDKYDLRTKGMCLHEKKNKISIINDKILYECFDELLSKTWYNLKLEVEKLNKPCNNYFKCSCVDEILTLNCELYLNKIKPLFDEMLEIKEARNLLKEKGAILHSMR